MTVIAWDGRQVAADSMSILNGRKIYGQVQKLVEKDGVVYATTGFWGLRDAWIKWYEDGADPAKTPPHGHSDNDIGAFIVFKDGKCFVYSMIVPYPVEEIAPAAFGSGSDFAIGAMYAGATAAKSAGIAADQAYGCGGIVQVIDLAGFKEKNR